MDKTVRKLLLVFIPAALCAQSSFDQGRALFRSNCAFCHGMTATGGRGPNLVSASLSHGDTDASIKRVIRIGVPGTTMPAFSEFTDEEVGQVIQYLRSLSKSAARKETVPGNAPHGKQVYEEKDCSGCHRIAGQGSIFGPELTRIGGARSIEYLRDSIVKPSADVPEGYEGVTVVLKNGQRIRGLRINEDTFSIQLRDPGQQTRMFQKDELMELTHEKDSMMPAYDRLSAADLQDLVAYLATLRGAVDSSAAIKKARGIK